MCLDLFSKDTSCGSILVSDHLLEATAKSFGCMVAYRRLDYTSNHYLFLLIFLTNTKETKTCV